MSHRVPPEGANVFAVPPGDTRTVWLVPTSDGKCLHCRFPSITAFPLHNRPVVTEVIDMASKPRIQHPLSPDVYKTLPIEEEG